MTRQWKRTLPLCAVALIVVIWFGRAPMFRAAREVDEFASTRLLHRQYAGDSATGNDGAVADAKAREIGKSADAVGRHSEAETKRSVPIAPTTPVSRAAAARNGGPAQSDRDIPTRANRPGPAGQAILATRQRLERDLGTFFAVNEFDADTRKRVVDVLCENSAESDDIYALSQSEGLSSSARSALLQGAFKTMNHTLQGLIGDDATKELFAYQLGIHLAQPFVEQCKSAGVPLSDSAFTAIAENVALNVAPANAPLPTPTEPWQQSFDTHRASSLAAAEQVLTPQQMNLFRAYWAQHPTRESVARNVAPSLPAGR